MVPWTGTTDFGNTVVGVGDNGNLQLALNILRFEFNVI